MSTGASEKEGDEKVEAETTKETDGADTPAEEEGDDIEKKLEDLSAQVSDLKDQLLRSLAEQENIRAIARRDVDAAKQFSIKSFAKSLLDVSDNLQRALESVEPDAENPALDSLYQGVQMTNEGLLKAFQANGLELYCKEPGDNFDPAIHEALMEYPDPSKESGTVGQVIKVGFKLNQRVLRPAEVGVVKNGS